MGVWEAVSDSRQAYTGHGWKVPRWLASLMKGLAVTIYSSSSERGHTHTQEHIHMLAFLRVTTSSWVLFQWKVPSCSAKLLTRAKQSGDWGGRKERWGKVGEIGVRRGDKRSRELSTSWDVCRTRCRCGAVSYCTALTSRRWLCRLGRCLVICCCLHVIIHSQTARILNWTSPCQTQTRSLTLFSPEQDLIDLTHRSTASLFEECTKLCPVD